MAIVDLDDIEEVFVLVIDRMTQMQIEEGLPVFAIPLRLVERSV